MKILTVGIPTYNRAHYLRENLENMLPQLISKQDVIELIVNDNASVDDTTAVVSELQQKYNFPITYAKHPNNMGVSANVMDIVDKAMGRYIYLMGDDDVLSPNFFDVILRIISENDGLGLIHFGYLVGDSFCSNTKIYDSKYNGMMNVYDSRDFIKRTLSNTSFMSSLIFLKEIWYEGILKIGIIENYYGYELYATLLWGSLNKQCLYYYMPLVIARNPSRTWDNMAALYMFVGLGNIFYDLNVEIPGVYNKWQDKLRKTNDFDFWPLIFLFSRDQKFNRTRIKEINRHLKSKFEKLIVLIILYLKPANTIKIICLLCLRFFRLFSRKYVFIKNISRNS
jgi:glycosyltransferase involved in cell wall biosynthesis